MSKIKATVSSRRLYLLYVLFRYFCWLRKRAAWHDAYIILTRENPRKTRKHRFFGLFFAHHVKIPTSGASFVSTALPMPPRQPCFGQHTYPRTRVSPPPYCLCFGEIQQAHNRPSTAIIQMSRSCTVFHLIDKQHDMDT